MSLKINYDKYPHLKVYETHGVEFTKTAGDEFIGTCPFTGKRDKFYVNRKTGLWDSKTAGLSGNIARFLEEVSEEYQSDFEDEQRNKLAKARKLPLDAFTGWELGWNGSHYTLAVRDVEGRVQDIRLYNLQRRFMRSTAGAKVGLLGAHRLKDEHTAPIYICEGEWDAIALTWLFRQTRTKAVVVGVPGAGIFKPEWATLFSGRKVYACYDHDDPGRKGEQKVHERLGSVAKSMRFIHWPDELPEGWDVRDWIVHGIKRGDLDKCQEYLFKLFRPVPRKAGNARKTSSGLVIRLIGRPTVEAERPDVVPTLADVYAVYKKWLHLPNMDAIDVMLATALSNRMDGPPVWMFLVSPPGGAKTITMEGLAEYEHSYSQSSLTAHALISGANFAGASDPSLIPRLDGKILLIKDFTTVLNLRDDEKEQIFGILRDAYDGRCGKVFGNGVERTYQSHFTIIAAVTPKIYELGHRHAALGERFLKFRMGDNLDHFEEDKIIRRAIENVDHDAEMKADLQRVTGAFLQYGFEEFPDVTIDETMATRLKHLAMFGSRLRGTVSRDNYRDDMMTGKPYREVGSRLGIQLSKLARSLTILRGKATVGDAEYTLVKKVMLDTVSQRSEDILRALFAHEQTRKPQTAFLTVNDLSTETRYPRTTVQRIIEDLNLLQVVERIGDKGSGYKNSWRLTSIMSRDIAGSLVYAEPRRPRIVLRAGKGSRPDGSGRA